MREARHRPPLPLLSLPPLSLQVCVVGRAHPYGYCIYQALLLAMKLDVATYALIYICILRA